MAFQSSEGDENEGLADMIGFKAWSDTKCEQHTQYWAMVLTLKRWMFAGPEVARAVTEFENTCMNIGIKSLKYHEQTPAVQRKFINHVKSVVAVFKELGNPFCEDGNDLLI